MKDRNKFGDCSRCGEAALHAVCMSCKVLAGEARFGVGAYGIRAQELAEQARRDPDRPLPWGLAGHYAPQKKVDDRDGDPVGSFTGSTKTEGKRMTEINVDIEEAENGGFIARFHWDCPADSGGHCAMGDPEEDRGCGERHRAVHAHSDRDALVRDVVQFLTETGDWGEGGSDDKEELKAASLLEKHLGGGR